MAVVARPDLRRIIDLDVSEKTSERCKICQSEALFFAKVDLGKSCSSDPYPLGRYGVDIPYYQCAECGFIFTVAFDGFTDRRWREFIYNDDYAKVDPAYVEERPRSNAYVSEAYLKAVGGSPVGLDYGGGNGLAAALLRERGWVYDSVDPHGGKDHITARGQYTFCTAFEVIEHAPAPQTALKDLSDRCVVGQLLVLIGTNVSDGAVSPKTKLDWWYAGPRNGHISLYSRKALKLLAAGGGFHYFSLGRNLHFLSRGYGSEEVLRIAIEGKLRRIFGAPRNRMGPPPP